MVSLTFLFIIVTLWITAAGLIDGGLDLISSKYYRNNTTAGIMFLMGGGICITAIFFMLYWLGRALI